jgi:ring-1,2-phenylacetyl-CoA epoxidase subunit PaaD
MEGRMEQTELTQEVARKALSVIVDPEIPAVTLMEMKIIRDVTVENGAVRVLFSPTFMGCPALDLMKREIHDSLHQVGFRNVSIDVTFSPPWSTDMLDEQVREKLRAFGIAPPPPTGESLPATLQLPVSCPFCGSSNTHLESRFGSTLCRQIYYCDSCRQSFDRFKPI